MYSLELIDINTMIKKIFFLYDEVFHNKNTIINLFCCRHCKIERIVSEDLLTSLRMKTELLKRTYLGISSSGP